MKARRAFDIKSTAGEKANARNLCGTSGRGVGLKWKSGRARDPDSNRYKKKKKASSQNQKEKKGIEQHSVPVDVDYHGEIWL